MPDHSEPSTGRLARSGQVAGVDVGGTFTDLVLFDQATGGVQLAKVASTLDNQAFGVLQALNDGGASLADTRGRNACLRDRLSSYPGGGMPGRGVREGALEEQAAQGGDEPGAYGGYPFLGAVGLGR